ncbi:solute carrier organic anion transporter family member 4A1-like [Styela clava]
MKENISIDGTTCGIQISSGTKRYIFTGLQRFASPRWALAFLSLAYLFSDGVLLGVFNVTITTIEKQFHLRTMESGVIGGMIDLGACIALIAAIFYGEKLFKTQWIGRGILISGLGCIIFVIPHFTSPRYTYGYGVTNYCGNVTEMNCSASPIRNYRFIFMLGTFCCGIGSEFLPSIGITYLDENVKQRYSSMYNGIFYSSSAVGTSIGYLLGGVTLELYNQPYQSVSIDTTSSLWVGAWWIGYLVGGIGIILSSVPVMFLPKKLPSTNGLRKEREQRKDDSERRGEEKHIGKQLLDLFKNGVFVSVMLVGVMHKALIFGFANYSIKLGVELLGLEETRAAYYLGALVIVASTLGYVISGGVITKFDLKLEGILKFMLGTSFVSFLFVFGFMLKCPEKDFAGATIAVDTSNASNYIKSIESKCNTKCGCSTDRFNPVCDDLGVTYFSPCYAGCLTQMNETFFSDCQCLSGGNITSVVSSEKCAHEICPNMITMALILFVSYFSGFLAITPIVQATLRCVSFNQRTMALGVEKIAQILLGRLLGRLLFGEAVEAACLVSSTECGDRGTCRSFQKSNLARNITLLMASERFLAVVFVAVALLMLKRIPKRGKYIEESNRVDVNS